MEHEIKYWFWSNPGDIKINYIYINDKSSYLL